LEELDFQLRAMVEENSQPMEGKEFSDKSGESGDREKRARAVCLGERGTN